MWTGCQQVLCLWGSPTGHCFEQGVCVCVCGLLNKYLISESALIWYLIKPKILTGYSYSVIFRWKFLPKSPLCLSCLLTDRLSCCCWCFQFDHVLYQVLLSSGLFGSSLAVLETSLDRVSLFLNLIYSRLVLYHGSASDFIQHFGPAKTSSGNDQVCAVFYIWQSKPPKSESQQGACFYSD